MKEIVLGDVLKVISQDKENYHLAIKPTGFIRLLNAVFEVNFKIKNE